MLDTVPTLLSLFAGDMPGLRIIILGGEACRPPLVARFAKPGRQMFNTYGPTEATVVAPAGALEPGKLITIGQPLLELRAAVTSRDEDLQPAQPGAQGELCIGGPGLSSGYLGRPDLTAEKFLDNPWTPAATRACTAPATWRDRADGQVVCLGRTDDQVKIRGFRVELGEIEASWPSRTASAGRGPAAPGRRHRPPGRLPRARARGRRRAVDAVVLAQHDRRVETPGRSASFASISRDGTAEYLVVDAAVEKDGAVFVDADRVAGAVEDRVAAVVE